MAAMSSWPDFVPTEPRRLSVTVLTSLRISETWFSSVWIPGSSRMCVTSSPSFSSRWPSVPGMRAMKLSPIRLDARLPMTASS